VQVTSFLNNSTQSSATALHVDDADDDGNSLDAFFTAMSTVTSSTKGLVRLTKKSDSSAFLVFEITGVTDVSSSYWQLTISNLAYSGTAPFSNADDVLISFVMNGDKGDTGATGAAGADADLTSVRGTIQIVTTTTSGNTSSTSCPAGTTLLAGGCSTSYTNNVPANSGDEYMRWSYPSGSTWYCSFARNGGWHGGATTTAHATCL